MCLRGVMHTGRSIDTWRPKKRSHFHVTSNTIVIIYPTQTKEFSFLVTSLQQHSPGQERRKHLLASTVRGLPLDASYGGQVTITIDDNIVLNSLVKRCEEHIIIKKRKRNLYNKLVSQERIIIIHTQPSSKQSIKRVH